MQPAIGNKCRLSQQYTGIFVALLLMSNHGCAVAENTGVGATPQLTELVVLSLSIGKGVPQGTQRKLEEIKKLLESEGLTPQILAWGIEGERRLCIVADEQQLARLIKKIERMSEGVPLLNVAYQEASPEVRNHCKQ